MDFKKGDKVKVIDDDHPWWGKEGVVVEPGVPHVLVEWPNGGRDLVFWMSLGLVDKEEK